MTQETALQQAINRIKELQVSITSSSQQLGLAMAMDVLEELKPKNIKISDTTIMQLGFKSMEDGWYGLGRFTWNIYDKALRYNGTHLGEPDYIHNIQNIYLEIVGEELEIKNT